MTMDTFQEILEKQRVKLQSKLAKYPHLSPEEYEAAKLRVAANDYNGICRPDCPVCHGIGFIKANPDAQVGDADFGKIKHCQNVDMVKLYGEGLGLKEHEIRTLNWSSILPMSNAIQASEKVQAILKQGYGWITLWGNWGLAKSLILRIAIAESLRAGKMGAFVEMSEMLADLRQAFDSQNPSAESANRLDKWQGMKILAIDEIDKINKTDWAKEQEFSIFNRRYQDAIRQQSITLFASNQSPRQIGGALGDRMQDGRFVVVELKGTSNRPSMTTEQDY